MRYTTARINGAGTSSPEIAHGSSNSPEEIMEWAQDYMCLTEQYRLRSWLETATSSWYWRTEDCTICVFQYQEDSAEPAETDYLVVTSISGKMQHTYYTKETLYQYAEIYLGVTNTVSLKDWVEKNEIGHWYSADQRVAVFTLRKVVEIPAPRPEQQFLCLKWRGDKFFHKRCGVKEMLQFYIENYQGDRLLINLPLMVEWAQNPTEATFFNDMKCHIHPI